MKSNQEWLDELNINNWIDYFKANSPKTVFITCKDNWFQRNKDYISAASSQLGYKFTGFKENHACFEK